MQPEHPQIEAPSFVSQHPLRATSLVILVGTALHVLQLQMFQFPLFGDEAQYWGWAKQLDWGYYSKPPMVAWSIALTTGLFGDVEFFVRLPSLIWHAVICFGLFLVGRDMFSARVGFWAALVWMTLPAVTVSSVTVSTDPPMLAAWVYCLWVFWRAVQDPHASLIWYALAGVLGGLGMLSKYPMIALPAGFVLYLIFSPQIRQRVKWSGFAMSVGLATLILLPNVLWNANNQFVSFIHLGENANVGGSLFHLDKLLEFWAGQAGVFGPILFGLFLWMLVRIRRHWPDPRYRLLFCVALPIFIVISAQGFLSRANANWASPTYIGATVAVVAWTIGTGSDRWLKVSVGLHIVVALVMTVLAVYSAQDQITLPKGLDPFRRLKSWDIAAAQIGAIGQERPDLPLVFDHRITLAQVLYYGEAPNPLLKWNPDPYINDQYELTTQLTPQDTPHVLLVVRTPNPETTYGAYFDSLTPVTTIDVPQGDRRLFYQIVEGKGFRGYGN